MTEMGVVKSSLMTLSLSVSELAHHHGMPCLCRHVLLDSSCTEQLYRWNAIWLIGRARGGGHTLCFGAVRVLDWLAMYNIHTHHTHTHNTHTTHTHTQ